MSEAKRPNQRAMLTPKREVVPCDEIRSGWRFDSHGFTGPRRINSRLSGKQYASQCVGPIDTPPTTEWGACGAGDEPWLKRPSRKGDKKSRRMKQAGKRRCVKLVEEYGGKSRRILPAEQPVCKAGRRISRHISRAELGTYFRSKNHERAGKTRIQSRCKAA